MEYITAHGALLFISLILLFAQLLVRQKRSVHIVFAIFCGSIAMFAAKQIGGDQLGVYQYLIGMGACATCNGYWLVSRALFRVKNAISVRHIVAAGSLGLLLVVGQALGWAQSVTQSEHVFLQNSETALYEVVNLFSSCILVLSAWEGFRGITTIKGKNFWQRILFLASYCSAVLISTILFNIAGSPEASAELKSTLSSLLAVQIMLVTQVLIIWRFHYTPTLVDNAAKSADVHERSQSDSTESESALLIKPSIINEEDRRLAENIESMLMQQNAYLQTNLKVADLARKMNVSEYRISRIFRDHLHARNFNHLINMLRIRHAKTLLKDPENKHWPIVVVGMESGFASVGPFTRAFKSSCDMTPNQYRNYHQTQTKKLHALLVG